MDAVFGKVTEIERTEIHQKSAGSYLLVACRRERLQLTDVLDSRAVADFTVCER